MARRRAGAGLALAALALTAAGCGLGGSTKTVTQTVTRTVTLTRTVTQSASSSTCSGDELSAKFSLLAGSQGAGQISYTLTLTNTSALTCTLTIQKVVLLGASDTPLPTKTFGALPSGVLAPGSSASADARFSPDVPSAGDSQGPSCQPKAFGLQVTPGGGGVVTAPVSPPTSVCGQGTLTFPSN